MITKKTGLISAILLTFIIQANAQYYSATHRQTEQDIQKFRMARVKMMTLSMTEGGAEVPFAINHYDTMGRVTLMANQKHHEHFKYDENGRLIYWIDSANDGRRFEKFEYNFGYGADNRVKTYSTAKTTSRFSAGGPGETKEDVLKNGILVERHSYTYNEDGKPTLEVNKDTAGKLIYFHKILYNKYGDLASEIIVNGLKNCRGDSTAIINSYDSKARIIQKQKTITNYTCDVRTPNGPVEKKTITESTSYVYDIKGRLVNENTNSSDPAHVNKKEYEYNFDGLPFKENNVDGKGKATTLAYHYYYHYKKK